MNKRLSGEQFCFLSGVTNPRLINGVVLDGPFPGPSGDDNTPDNLYRVALTTGDNPQWGEVKLMNEHPIRELLDVEMSTHLAAAKKIKELDDQIVELQAKRLFALAEAGVRGDVSLTECGLVYEIDTPEAW